MQDKFEELIKLVYKDWKSNIPKSQTPHPDEETLACFLESRLEDEEAEKIKEHLLSCENCMESIVLNLKLKASSEIKVPEAMLAKVKDLLLKESKYSFLEIVLRCKEKLIEIISTTGDVLVGLELVPAPILRSRNIKDFKDEVTILKDFENMRVEVKIENKGVAQEGQIVNIIIAARDKDTQRILKDLRVTLLKDDLELESYLNHSGSVIFEHVLFGKYTIELSTIDEKVASILLDIRV